jgi:hypothetical protein
MEALTEIQNAQAQEILERIIRQEDHLSFSSINAFRRSPLDFIRYKLGIREETESMIYGSMVHTLILQAHLFDEKYVIKDDFAICQEIGGAKPRATNRYKEWFAGWEASAGDRTIVDQEDYLLAQSIATATKLNKASAKVLYGPEGQDGICEVPIEGEILNFLFKGFIDKLFPVYAVDIKTCPDAEKKKFQRTIIDKGYYIQAAIYKLLCPQIEEFYFIAVDKMGGISVHRIEKGLMRQGIADFRELCKAFNHAYLTEAFDRSFDFWAEVRDNKFDGIFDCERGYGMYA